MPINDSSNHRRNSSGKFDLSLMGMLTNARLGAGAGASAKERLPALALTSCSKDAEFHSPSWLLLGLVQKRGLLQVCSLIGRGASSVDLGLRLGDEAPVRGRCAPRAMCLLAEVAAEDAAGGESSGAGGMEERS